MLSTSDVSSFFEGAATLACLIRLLGGVRVWEWSPVRCENGERLDRLAIDHHVTAIKALDKNILAFRLLYGNISLLRSGSLLSLQPGTIESDVVLQHQLLLVLPHNSLHCVHTSGGCQPPVKKWSLLTLQFFLSFYISLSDVIVVQVLHPVENPIVSLSAHDYLQQKNIFA